MSELTNLTNAAYRTSSFSGGGNCVQVAQLPDGGIAVKHSRSDGPRFVCTAAEWDAFVTGVKHGEFDFSSGDVPE